MDKRLREIFDQETSVEAVDYNDGVLDGFEFAIKRLRENKYYGHYAQNLADWLEKHLTEQVSEPTITNLKGDK